MSRGIIFKNACVYMNLLQKLRLVLGGTTRHLRVKQYIFSKTLYQNRDKSIKTKFFNHFHQSESCGLKLKYVHIYICESLNNNNF